MNQVVSFRSIVVKKKGRKIMKSQSLRESGRFVRRTGIGGKEKLAKKSQSLRESGRFVRIVTNV